MANEHITLNIKDIREAYGAKVDDVALYVGVTPGTIRSWEKNKTFPSVEQLYLLARMFREPMGAFVNYDQKRRWADAL